MILLFAVILSLLIALLRGGRLYQLGSISFCYGWVALLAFALQVLIIYFPLPKTQGFWGVRTLLLLGSYVLLGLVIFANRHLPGLPLLGLGFALNLLVMVVNGGFMPITPQALEKAGLGHLALGNEPGARILNAKDVLLAREETHLWVLSDIFALPPPIKSVFSIGDLLLSIGVFILFQRTMRAKA